MDHQCMGFCADVGRARPDRRPARRSGDGARQRSRRRAGRSSYPALVGGGADLSGGHGPWRIPLSPRPARHSLSLGDALPPPQRHGPQRHQRPAPLLAGARDQIGDHLARGVSDVQGGRFYLWRLLRGLAGEFPIPRQSALGGRPSLVAHQHPAVSSPSPFHRSGA